MGQGEEDKRARIEHFTHYNFSLHVVLKRIVLRKPELFEVLGHKENGRENQNAPFERIVVEQHEKENVVVQTCGVESQVLWRDVPTSFLHKSQAVKRMVNHEVKKEEFWGPVWLALPQKPPNEAEKHAFRLPNQHVVLNLRLSQLCQPGKHQTANADQRYRKQQRIEPLDLDLLEVPADLRVPYVQGEVVQ